MGIITKINAGGTDHLIASSAYGTCTTAAGTAAKVVTLSNFDTLTAGVTIHVRFTYSNTVANPTLNVNSKGAKPIYAYGTTAPGTTVGTSWQAGAVVSFTYNTDNNSSGCWVMNNYIADTDTDNDTKVTSSANHYTPSTASGNDKTASASGATAAWSIDVVKGITINTDGKGHITGLSVTSGKIPANPDTNTTYSLSGALSSHKFTSTLTATNPSGTSTSDFTLAAGTGISITDDTTNRKMTIGNSGVTSITTSAGIHSTKSSATGAVSFNVPTKTSHLTNDSGFITSYTDTKNTAGSTNTSSKIFLIGAISQATSPQTFSLVTVYVRTDGGLTVEGSLIAGNTNCSASGLYAFAGGLNSTATANYSMAFGESTRASGIKCTAIGCYTNARGHRSVALGCSTIAGSTSIGDGISGDTNGAGYALAAGHLSQATGECSVALGESTIATHRGQVAIGRFNADTDCAFAIGNGSSTTYEWTLDPSQLSNNANWTVNSGITVTRKNIFEVDWDGKITIMGHSSAIGTVVSKLGGEDYTTNVTAAADTWKALASLNLSIGVYIVFARARFAPTNSGAHYSDLNISTTSANSLIRDRLYGATTSSNQHSTCTWVNITENNTNIYLNGKGSVAGTWDRSNASALYLSAMRIR